MRKPAKIVIELDPDLDVEGEAADAELTIDEYLQIFVDTVRECARDTLPGRTPKVSYVYPQLAPPPNEVPGHLINLVELRPLEHDPEHVQLLVTCACGYKSGFANNTRGYRNRPLAEGVGRAHINSERRKLETETEKNRGA